MASKRQSKVSFSSINISHNSSNKTLCTNSRVLKHPCTPKNQLVGYKPNKCISTKDLNLDFFSNAQMPNSLSSESISAIHKFKEKKINEYKSVIDDFSQLSNMSPIGQSNKAKVKVINNSTSKKSEKIFQTKCKEEKDRIQKSFTLQAENLKYNFIRNKEKKLKEESTSKKLLINKKENELKKNSEKIKSLIIQNIDNLYTDKIKLLKEQVSEEKITTKSLQAEVKRLQLLSPSSSKKEKK